MSRFTLGSFCSGVGRLGWTKVTNRAGMVAGATSPWSKPRLEGHPAKGRKTLWLWRYDRDGTA